MKNLFKNLGHMAATSNFVLLSGRLLITNVIQDTVTKIKKRSGIPLV
ncbi:MAG: hypothetical protein HN353_09120 [Bdellovibrionales bacterium]|nr:hypothetical protein [Bdellovibrionales bacterium]MBT3525685.1 hypothetical protein [Bdellovibrionales bacterium]MBT7669465.1 hypothetical protein [Bdellovibrionales bacterium]MBT7768247.1 hypothetical protein [Bdellovibrionales bacterium]